MTEIIKGHISPETAYVVDDYPYGFRLRCKIRYWLEYKSGKGVRFVSQTSNPKKPGLVWNKPKASTYCRFGGCMFLDENEHVHWNGLTEYSNGKEALAFSAQYREGVHPEALDILDRWTAAKVAYDAERESNPQAADDLTVGLTQAYRAFAKAGSHD